MIGVIDRLRWLVGKKHEDLLFLLIEATAKGFSARELYGYVRERSGKFSAKRFQQAALEALAKDGEIDKQLVEDAYSYAAYNKMAG